MRRGHPVITFFLCIILLVVLLATSFVGVVQNIVSEEAITETVTNIVTDIDARLLFEELEVYDRLTEIVDEEIIEAIEAVGITPETISEVLNRELVRNLITDSAVELIEAFIGRQETITIYQEAIFELIREHSEYLEQELGVVIKEQYIEELREVLEAHNVPESITVDIPQIETVESAVGVDLDGVRWILEPGTFAILSLACVLLLGLMFLLNLREIRISFFAAGMASLISGVVVILVGMSLTAIISIFVDSEFIRQVLESLFAQARSVILTVGWWQLGVSAVFFASFGVLGIWKNKN